LVAAFRNRFGAFVPPDKTESKSATLAASSVIASEAKQSIVPQVAVHANTIESVWSLQARHRRNNTKATWKR
jgi:hypothetical protein